VGAVGWFAKAEGLDPGTDVIALDAELGVPLPGDFPPDFPARYNVAPTEDVPVVRAAPPPASEGAAPQSQTGTGAGKPVRIDLLHWGLVPSWAEDPSVGNRMINARAETAATKPAFRDAMRRRRCLIPADGFYEWRKLADAAPDSDAPAKGKRKPAVRKQPYLFRMKGDKPFAFGGLWDTWWRDGKKLESFTILTTTPNGLVRFTPNGTIYVAENSRVRRITPDGTIDTMKLQPISPLADFSFNYQDFLFTPLEAAPAKQ